MILLITPSSKGQECALALQQATSEQTSLASTLRQASSLLRSEEFSAVVIDQLVLDSEPDESETLLQHVGTAIPVYVNLAVSGIRRLVNELRVALQRRQREAQVARKQAERELR